jgi:hypothetical protein
VARRDQAGGQESHAERNTFGFVRLEPLQDKILSNNNCLEAYFVRLR